MGGNTTGGLLTAAKILARDPDHYRRIGKLGGKKGTGGGFSGDSTRARITGKLGGRRPKSGRMSMARKQEIIHARQALKALNKQRGMV